MTTASPLAAAIENFEATGIGVSITVRDLQKSVAWYCDVLGFTIDRKIERDGTLRAVAVKAGNVRLMLNQDDGAKGWDRVKGEGVSFMFTTTQSVDAVAARIRNAGGTLQTEPADMPWGARVFRVADPDGFKLAVSGAPTGSA